jgi:hypothetical protein
MRQNVLEWAHEPTAPSTTREIRTKYAAAMTSQFCGEEIKITPLARESRNANHGHTVTDRPPIGKSDAMEPSG